MEFVNYMDMGIGLLLIVVGWLCYRFPNMINPYGSMSEERKALVDIDGLKRALAIIMTVIGGLMIVVALLGAFHVFDEMVSSWVFIGLCLAMLVPLFIAMRKYNGFGRDYTGEGVKDKGVSLFRFNLFRLGGGNQLKSASTVTWVITGLSLVFVAVIVATSIRPQQITVGEEKVSISGMYGRDIPVSDIVSVELLEKLPSIKMRTNGSSTGNYSKGHFMLENGEKCMLFVRHKMPPYIEIRTSDNLYYINGSSAEETLELFGNMKELIDTN